METFPIERATDAFRHMAQAKHIGKIVLTFGKESAPPLEGPFRSDATYLITGGLGALGLEIARHMVARGARHLVLAGRRAPASAAADAVTALEREGAVVKVAQVDVSDDVEVGWVGGRHVLDREFDADKNFILECVHFGLRIDAAKVPPDLMRAYMEMELEALRQAQLDMLRNGARNVVRSKDAGPTPPYNWAAFVLSGDWR